MKIAIWHDLNSGGGKRALYGHVKGLVERGHEVVSFCPDTADPNFLPLSDLVEERVFPLKSAYQKKTALFGNSIPHVHAKTRAMLEHCKECAEIINNEDFDVLFANSSTYSYMAHIGRFIKIPKLIYLGEPFRYLYEAQPDYLWKAPNADSNKIKYFLARTKHLIRMYWYSYMVREEYLSAKSYDLILVNSYFSRESVKRAYNLESKVCYLGIDTSKFYRADSNKENYVIGMGYVQASKGIDIAINSLSKIDKKYRPDLKWIGNNKKTDSEYINYIKKLAESLDVRLTIYFSISDEQLQTLLSKASVFLYFSNLEPFGLAPLEANACGTAVISIAEGGPRESIKNGINGYLVNDQSYEEIANRINLFCEDQTLAEVMGKNAIEYVTNNWNITTGINNIEFWLKQIALSPSN
jgi:glycosyltransferase involved in cell wall biosynthesis